MNKDDQLKVSECAKLISTLTNYPYEVVHNVLIAARYVQLDELADKCNDENGFPESFEVNIPTYGKVVVDRLLNGRTDDLSWTFIPTEEFLELFKSAAYEGTTPLVKIARKNFDEVMKFRYENIVRESEVDMYE